MADRRTPLLLGGAAGACAATSGTPGGGSMQGLPASEPTSAMRSTGSLVKGCGPRLVAGRSELGSSKGGCGNLQ